ncbi:MAG: hypothetical protein ABWX96_20070 [Propionibacteriaceae bacterium]
MTINDIETPSTAVLTTGQRFARLLRAWATAYVNTYEPLTKTGGTIDPTTRLRWMPIA